MLDFLMKRNGFLFESEVQLVISYVSIEINSNITVIRLPESIKYCQLSGERISSKNTINLMRAP